MNNKLSIFVLFFLCCVAITSNEAKQQAKAIVNKKTYEPMSKSTALKSVSSKLKGLAASQPSSTKPEKQVTPALKSLSEEELKRIKTLYNKMNTISINISTLIPILEKDRLRKMRDGRTAVDHLRDAYGKLEQLKPQFRAIEERFPQGKEVVNTIKKLERQVKAVLDDEERAGKATIAKKELEKKVAEKEKAALPPSGIVGAECSLGPCCNKVTFKFLAAGVGCQASECVSSMICLGASEMCPPGTPVADGTSCSKGKCLSGVCVHEENLSENCQEGACCNVADGTVKEKGTPCDVPEDSCQEPAAFCSGESSTCETTDKPDGAFCGKESEGICDQGKCVNVQEDDHLSGEEKDALTAAQRKTLAQKRAQLKQAKKKQEYRELKHLVRRFGVLLWMNNKLDTLSADKKVSDYLAAVPGTPTAKQIFEHHRIPTESNKLWDSYFKTTTENEGVATRGIPITSLIATESSSAAATASTNALQSSASPSTSAVSVVGIILIVVGFLLIVAYFVFGGKKKEPQVIY